MSEFEWIVVGLLAFCALQLHALARHTDGILKSLAQLGDRLAQIDELIGMIPGVESYRPPEIGEWSEARKLNPDANSHNRRNWPR